MMVKGVNPFVVGMNDDRDFSIHREPEPQPEPAPQPEQAPEPTRTAAPRRTAASKEQPAGGRRRSTMSRPNPQARRCRKTIPGKTQQELFYETD